MKVKTSIQSSLCRAILETSKIVMYKFWYAYMKVKYGAKAKVCSMDTDSIM